MNLNPHNHIVRQGRPPKDLWECQYCGMVDVYDDLRATACSYVYPPCEHCGQTPECAPDCSGIAAALATPGVRLR